MKKILSFALLTVALGLTSCGGISTTTSTKPSGNSEQKQSTVESNKTSNTSKDSTTQGSTLRMESEYTNLTGIVGSGISGAASGLDLIQSSKNASNGYYIGFTHREGFALTYTFNSSVDATDVTVALGLGNELGIGLEYTASTLTVSVNEINMNYSKFTVKVDGFNAYALGKISVKKGENTIVTTVVGPNEYCNNATGGPLFDYVELKSSVSELTWTPLTSNVEDE